MTYRFKHHHQHHQSQWSGCCSQASIVQDSPSDIIGISETHLQSQYHTAYREHPGGHFLYKMVEPGYPAKPFFRHYKMGKNVWSGF